ncbi:BA75_03437T0 [Komagataella pastoris]|uniref:BA75_03437T0 n=1 Tax=Komagataella pastoris TaxID=4922 RepID=A0A1B2JFI2_PICPA|nr:BA75_03437T0 [Komagataella pastoris]
MAKSVKNFEELNSVHQNIPSEPKHDSASSSSTLPSNLENEEDNLEQNVVTLSDYRKQRDIIRPIDLRESDEQFPELPNINHHSVATKKSWNFWFWKATDTPNSMLEPENVTDNHSDISIGSQTDSSHSAQAESTFVAAEAAPARPKDQGWQFWKWGNELTNSSKRNSLLNPEINHSFSSLYSTSSKAKLADDAKRAIKRNTVTSHWAYFKSSEHTDYAELAVIGTGSASNPVKVEVDLAATPLELEESMPLLDTQAKKEADLGSSSNSTDKTRVSSDSSGILAPTIECNYRVITSTTRARLNLQRVNALRMLSCKIVKEESHLYIKENNPNLNSIFKAVVIGVHGFLPIRMVRTLVGQPTGTASMFAAHATEALQSWGQSHHLNMKIDVVALEGEGKILERVGSLLSLLENWLDVIKNCDFLYFASHSQGVPVAIHIAAQLFKQNVLNPNQKVALLNMAGICLGPFPELDAKLAIKAYSRLENEIMMELFDFQDPDTLQSRKLIESLEILVSHDTKLTFVGSLDDQLVPLFSSTCFHVAHPNIFRSIHVDKTSEHASFLANLMKSCMMVRNLGHDDHNLNYEISRYLIGSVGVGGHCKIFKDLNVYTLGIENALLTTSLTNPKPMTYQEINSKTIINNPYHLPWSFRGFVQQLLELKHINSIKLVQEIVESYIDWNPSTKNLRDLSRCIDILETVDIGELIESVKTS